jgi:hypothetical protein
MASDFSVDPGDCFASIAKAKGFFNYRTLYDHADNAALKAKRPNPNQLVEDDVVQIPDKAFKVVNLTLDGTKKFVLDRRKTKLRILLTDSKKTALTPVSCVATVGSAAFSSTALPAGLIELVIDAEEKSGTLVAIFKALPPLGSPPADPPAANPPANPPVIRASEFRDSLPTPQTDALSVVWELNLGSLEPKDVVRGSLQRLYNLTYPTPVRKDENEKTSVYVKGYQALKKAATKSGQVSDIRDELATFHDHP